MDHQAFAQMLGSYGEFVGAIAVVATLAYLAIQIRQQNTEARAKSVHDILWGFRDAQKALADPETAELAVKLLEADGLDSLSNTEWVRLINTYMPILRVWEEAFHYHQSGRLPDEIWEAFVAQNSIVIGAKRGGDLWKARRHVFTKSFAAYVDSLELGEVPYR